MRSVKIGSRQCLSDIVSPCPAYVKLHWLTTATAVQSRYTHRRQKPMYHAAVGFPHHT